MAGHRLLDGGDSIVGREAVVVTVIDDEGRSVITAAHTGDIADAQLMLRHALKSLFKLALQCGSATEMAAHVVANLYADPGWRVKVEVRIKAGDGMDVAQMHASALSHPPQLFWREVMLRMPALDIFEFFKDTVSFVFHLQYFERAWRRQNGVSLGSGFMETMTCSRCWRNIAQEPYLVISI